MSANVLTFPGRGFPSRGRSAGVGVVLLTVLAVIVALALIAAFYVALPLVLGVLVFPSLLGLTGWGVFLSTVASFAGVWLVLAALGRLNK